MSHESSSNASKKSRERHSFDLVYGGQVLSDVQGFENPDFIVKRRRDSQPFGVEVTEYFPSEPFARLQRIDGYSQDLLQGGTFRHKDDRKALEITQMEVLREDDSVAAKDVPAIMQKVPTLAERAIEVSRRIVEKGGRIRASKAHLSHTNLVIHDRSMLLRSFTSSELYQTNLAPELTNVLESSPFREIYLITHSDEGMVHVPLKMLYLTAEAYLFIGAATDTGYVKITSSPCDLVDQFAAYLASKVSTAVWIRNVSIGREVIFGNTGIVVSPDLSLTVRMYDDRPIGPDAQSPAVEWDKESSLASDLMTFRDKNLFSASFAFPVFSPAMST